MNKEYILSPSEFAVVQEFNKKIDELANQRQGAIIMVARSHDLQGNWDFRGDKFVLVEPPAEPKEDK